MEVDRLGEIESGLDGVLRLSCGGHRVFGCVAFFEQV